MKKQTLRVILNIIEACAGMDVPTLRQELPGILRRCLRTKSAHWVELEDISGHGPISSAGALGRHTERRIRQQISSGLREGVNCWNDSVFSYMEIQLPGRLGYVVLERTMSQSWLEVFRELLQSTWTSALKLTAAKDLAFVDDVTGLYNQRYLHLVLEKEIKRAERAKQPFSILFIDVDHFKSVNDTAGHMVGSKLLAGVGELLRGHTRMIDYAFRYGGDEFVLILVGTDSREAHEVGERIRGQVESTPFLIDGLPVKLTISIGVAAFPEHAKRKEDILRMADEAMYASKSRNRNTVSVAG